MADELSLLLRDQPYQVRCLLARTRRLATGLPTVWEAFKCGDVDAEQIRVIDRVARRVTEAATLDAIDDQVIEATRTRTPKQLHVWLLRLVVRLEPLAFEERHRRALAERRVTVVQGADDPRTDKQRRSDLFADLLLGRLRLDDTDNDVEELNDEGGEPGAAAESDWLEVEDIDPDTGELLGTHLQPIDANGQPIAEPVDAVTHRPPGQAPKLVRRPRTIRIGVVVPLTSLLSKNDTPAELADRTGFIPGETLRQHIADAIDSDRCDQVLFTRLLTDGGGRLIDTTELGRYPSTRLAQAITIRAGTCRYPSCTVPADRCDLDHHEPVPKGITSGTNMDPFCRRHHRGKT